jgi:hypothetical protein
MKTPAKAKAAIENLINGNLTDAKELAKSFSCWKIMSAAEELGYTSPVQYTAMAGFLKGVIDFRKYCDTMNK